MASPRLRHFQITAIAFVLTLVVVPVSLAADPGMDDAHVAIEKLTNGSDADVAGGADVPQIAIGDPVTWTYIVTNTGSVPLVNVKVRDDHRVPVFFFGGDDDGDGWLDLGETWIFEATGVALDLSTAANTVPGCEDGRPTYRNVGMAIARTGNWQSTGAYDYSHYCNPADGDGEEENPAVAIEKATNGNDADDPFGGDVPQLEPGDEVIWTYVVTNTGDVDLTDIVVVDDQGLTPVLVGGDDGDGLLNPGESWTYEAAGLAMDLDGSSFPDGCDAGNPRPTYENVGAVAALSPAGTTVTASDLSHYCNEEVGPVVIIVDSTG